MIFILKIRRIFLLYRILFVEKIKKFQRNYDIYSQLSLEKKILYFYYEFILFKISSVNFKKKIKTHLTFVINEISLIKS